MSGHFNPRTREGCDVPQPFPGYAQIRHFNPRTREGCDANDVVNQINISKISIHAPVKGATRLDTTLLHVPFHFNPRTREGCDPDRQLLYLLVGVISIHAPVKGATSADSKFP